MSAKTETMLKHFFKTRGSQTERETKSRYAKLAEGFNTLEYLMPEDIPRGGAWSTPANLRLRPMCYKLACTHRREKKYSQTYLSS